MVRRYTRVISSVLLLLFVSYSLFLAFTINRINPLPLIDYAINPEDLMHDEAVYFPGISHVLEWKIKNLSEREMENVIDHPMITPYWVLALSFSYPENNEQKFERAKRILKVLRNSGLSLYKVDSRSCSSFFSATYPLKMGDAYMNEVEIEGHRAIAEYLIEIGELSKYQQANANCALIRSGSKRSPDRA